MKAYNIKPETVKLGDFEIQAVVLGEKGRGRTQTIVPATDAGFIEPGLTKTGKPRLNKATGTPNAVATGYIARISTHGSYIRGANGWVGIHESKFEQSKLIAKGQGAFGDAGRTGTWDDVIVQLPDYTLVRVKPSRGDAYFLWFGLNSVTRLSAEEAEAYADNDPEFPAALAKENFKRV